MKTKIILSYFILLAILLSSCVKEEFNGDLLSKSVDVNAGIAVPIGYTTLSLSKLLTETAKPEELVIDADSFMTLYFHKEAFSYTAADLISIDPVSTTTQLENTFPIALDLSTFSSGTILSDTTMVSVGFDRPNGERLDSIVLKEAELILRAVPNSNVSINGTVQITFPTLRRNGIPYSTSFDLSSGGITNTDLANYTIGLQTIQDMSKMIPVEYSLNILSATGVVPAGESLIDLTVNFSYMDYKEIYGYLGIQDINIEETGFALDFYKEILEGSFHFEAPEINLFFNNSFGVPLGVSLPDFYTTNRDNSTTDITSDLITDPANPYVIAYPGYTQIGQSVADTLRLTPQTTNMFDVLEKAPLRVDYSVLGQTNPNSSGGLNFITENSSFNIDVEMVLPLWGYAQTLLMQDTLRFDLNELYNKDIEELKQLTFRLNFVNGFPIEVISQIYFVDENYQLQDSLFVDNNIIEGAIDSNSDGIFEAVKSPALSVTIDRDKINRIENTKHILIRGRIATTNIAEKQNVKFYSYYKLDANLGVIATVVANTSNY